MTNPIGVVLCEAFSTAGRQATSEANLTAADSGKLLAHGVATCMILEA
jgi:acyl-coenzyme A thioesterase PaaI-like protein